MPVRVCRTPGAIDDDRVTDSHLGCLRIELVERPQVVGAARLEPHDRDLGVRAGQALEGPTELVLLGPALCPDAGDDTGVRVPLAVHRFTDEQQDGPTDTQQGEPEDDRVAVGAGADARHQVHHHADGRDDDQNGAPRAEWLVETIH